MMSEYDKMVEILVDLEKRQSELREYQMGGTLTEAIYAISARIDELSVTKEAG